MRLIKYIDISQIIIDHYPMNPSTLALIEYLVIGGKIPPIKVAKLQNGRFLIKDGRHRVLAYKLLGIKKIKAKFSEKSLLLDIGETK